MKDRITEYLLARKEEHLELLLTLCRIPAPSGKEEQRAEYIKNWLAPYGEAYIDEALNVVFTAFDNGEKDAILICAHTDTVFPDMVPFEPEIKDGYIHCPGVGDDTANVAALLMLVKALSELSAKPCRPVIIVANSCEEGLGNLRGTKALMERYGDRISEFISLDGGYRGIVNAAVGSHRYRVSVKTPGGHSYGAFGNRNAIAALSELICDLYKIEAPTKAKTTYNVGAIEGGTSVNTIAQDASMLYEYRSEDRDCLASMKAQFDSLVEKANAAADTEFSVEVLGIRPCSGPVDAEALKNLTDRSIAAIKAVLPDGDIHLGAASTDCNIPLSMGIPAVCFGLYEGSGAHTRQEKVKLESLEIGLRVGSALMAQYFA